MAKITAFTLRRKMSKAGKTYYVAPYGNVDLLGFEVGASGDIEVSYVEREARPATAGYMKPQVAPGGRPKIVPRSGPITPRATPHHRPPPPPVPEDFVDHTAVPYEDTPMPDADDCPF